MALSHGTKNPLTPTNIWLLSLVSKGIIGTAMTCVEVKVAGFLKLFHSSKSFAQLREVISAS